MAVYATTGFNYADRYSSPMVYHIADDASGPNVLRMGSLAAATAINILLIVPVLEWQASFSQSDKLSSLRSPGE